MASTAKAIITTLPNFCPSHRNIKIGHRSGIAMCGRYSLAADLEDIQQHFKLFASDLTYSPRYNIAPTQPVLAVTNDEGRHPAYLRWGLIPSWAKSASVGNRLINARAETVAERPSFRSAFVRQAVSGPRRRFLRVADGSGNARRPMRVVMKSGEALRLCRYMGLVAEPCRRYGQVLHHHHHRTQRAPATHP